MSLYGDNITVSSKVKNYFHISPTVLSMHFKVVLISSK